MTPHLPEQQSLLGDADARPLTVDEGVELLRLWDEEVRRPPLTYDPKTPRGVVQPCRR